MSATLATLRARTQQFLLATGVTAWNTETLDEMLRQALAEYSQANPRQVETVLTLPAAGREIALSALPELVAVLDVWWPYSSTAAEHWPPNRVRGFRLDWDDGQPLLTLTSDAADQPATGDEVRLWYATPQHLDGLDGAAGTTLPLIHEGLLVMGAAGYAAFGRAAFMDADQPGVAAALQKWSGAILAQFQTRLAELRRQVAAHGPAFGEGWHLDEWENQGVVYPLPTTPRPRRP